VTHPRIQAPSRTHDELEQLRARVKELENALTQTQSMETTYSDAVQHFHSFMHHNPAAAWIKDEHGTYIYTNKAHQVLCGYSEGYIVGKTDYDIFDANIVPLLRENDLRVISENTTIQTIESGSAIAEEGNVRSWLVCKFPLTDISGRRLVGGVGLDVSDQMRSERDLREALRLQRLLLRELDHRVRNNLSSLMTLIDLTETATTTVTDFAASIRSRVLAMSVVHGLLSQKRWKSCRLDSLIESLVPREFRGRVNTHGNDVFVVATQGTALGMVLQELLSNSIKYGALSNANGTIDISWTATPDDEDCTVSMQWRENNGPTVNTACEAGVGTNLITGLIASELRGSVTLQYPASGAQHTLVMSLTRPNQNDDLV